tara:strand:+ start:2781 stop:4469 length:1689 start_codon:yes stop_codon:yes gene_type:complete
MNRMMCALAALVSGVVVVSAGAADGLFRAETPADGLAGPVPVEGVARAVPVVADFAAMDAVGVGDAVRLNLFPDADLGGAVTLVESRDFARYTWTGRMDAGGSFVLSVEEDAVMGAVWLDDGRAYEVRPGPGGRTWAVELDQAAFAPCGTDAEHCVHAGGHDHAPRPGGGARGAACADDGSVIDVLVVWTPAARSSSGGTNGMLSLISSAIASANNAYANSQIGTRLRLVFATEVAYSESSSNSTDLGRLRSTNDDFMDEVHALRVQYEADMVAMINAGSGSCGVAYLMTNLSTNFRSSAFSVTRYSCAVGNLTFAHELGHNMGSAHDRDNAGNALFSYSFGYRWVSTNGVQYRSVMAYSPGQRISRFSNPNVDYVGTPTGIPQGTAGAADNARSINEAASTVANFRLSNDAGPPVIVLAPSDQSLDAGQTAVFQAGVVSIDPVSFQWTRDGVVLVDDGRISGAQSATLTVDAVTPADAGAYVLAVANPCGSATADPAVLSVAGGCPADLAAPFGTLNFFDLSAYLALFGQQDADADLAAPFGVFNFFDLSAYIAAYNAGCP